MSGVFETGKYVGLKVNIKKTNTLVLGDGGTPDIQGKKLSMSQPTLIWVPSLTVKMVSTPKSTAD